MNNHDSSQKDTIKINGGRWIVSASSKGCENRYFFCPNPKGLEGPAVYKNNSRWYAAIFFALDL